jgi:hypothetical protein
MGWNIGGGGCIASLEERETPTPAPSRTFPCWDTWDSHSGRLSQAYAQVRCTAGTVGHLGQPGPSTRFPSPRSRVRVRRLHVHPAWAGGDLVGRERPRTMTNETETETETAIGALVFQHGGLLEHQGAIRARSQFGRSAGGSLDGWFAAWWPDNRATRGRGLTGDQTPGTSVIGSWGRVDEEAFCSLGRARTAPRRRPQSGSARRRRALDP